MAVPWALFDVDTRERFGAPRGPIFRERAECIRAHVERLVTVASQVGVPVLATTCSNSACVPRCGELGPTELWVSQDRWDCECLPSLADRSLILLEKRTGGSLEANDRLRTWEVFLRNPHAAQVVRELNAAEWGVFGHSAEYCVASTVRGLLVLGCSVTVLTDAVVAFNGTVHGSQETVEQLQSEGARLDNVDSFLFRLAVSPLHRPEQTSH